MFISYTAAGRNAAAEIALRFEHFEPNVVGKGATADSSVVYGWPSSRVLPMALSTLMYCTFLFAGAESRADDWANWRGPNHNGAVEAAGFFSDGPFGLKVLWKKSLGAGYSGVSIAKGRVLATFNEGDDDFLGAFDAESGEERWRYRLGKKYKAHDGGHDGPVSTPVADNETVYAISAYGLFTAVGLEDGAERWQVSLSKFNARVPFWGFTTTPIVVNDAVVVQVGGQNNDGLIAFDKTDGSVRWRQPCARVDYRSPVLAEIDGRKQILVSDDHATRGIDPATGEELWIRRPGISNDKTPLCVGSDRVLLTYRSGTEVIQIPAVGRDPTRIWRSKELRGNYATPVLHDDRLYGFTGGWLTCVDAESGRRLWRSRQPGGKGIILVDGHLVVFGVKGDVVVVEASPKGYREKARLSVSDADGYATPSFANGTIFVRNLQGDLIAVGKTDSPAIAQSKSEPPKTEFEAFVRKLSASNDKTTMLDEFMKAQSSFPIIEDDRFVHFVYRGATEDVGIRGNMIADGEEDQMHRVEGTDFFYRTYEIEPGARWEYLFTVDFDDRRSDPLNSRRAPGGGRSELFTSSWKQPEFIEKYDGKKAGRMVAFQWDGDHPVEVYLPNGYEEGEQRYPVVIVTDGYAWLRDGPFPNVLNQLTDDHTEPAIVAFLPGAGRSRGHGGNGTASYVRKLVRELVPAIDKRYRTRGDAASRTIFGKRGAAVAAVYAALEYPEVFGNCVAISYGRADTVRADLIAERIKREGANKPRFYIGWNRYEIWRPQSFDCRTQSRELTEALKQAGYDVRGGERIDSAGWRSWQIMAGDALLALFGRSQ